MTAAVITAKGFERAKSRLAGALDGPARSKLAREMFEHVLTAVQDCREVELVVVATDCSDVAALATGRGAKTIMDEAGADSLGAVVDAALDQLRKQGAQRAVVLMSDLPRLSADDVLCMLGALSDCDAALAPDRALAGTNALSLRLTPRRETCFGHPDSLQRHERALTEAGARVIHVERPGLAFDVDDVEDLETMRG